MGKGEQACFFEMPARRGKAEAGFKAAIPGRVSMAARGLPAAAYSAADVNALSRLLYGQRADGELQQRDHQAK